MYYILARKEIRPKLFSLTKKRNLCIKDFSIMSENWFRYGAFPPNHRPLTCSALLSSMLKSNCKVLTLPVQRKQTPFASCPVVRKSFLSWYLYYDHDFRKYHPFHLVPDSNCQLPCLFCDPLTNSVCLMLGKDILRAICNDIFLGSTPKNGAFLRQFSGYILRFLHPAPHKADIPYKAEKHYL